MDPIGLPHPLLQDLLPLQSNTMIRHHPLRRHLTTRWHRISLQILSHTFCQVEATTALPVQPGPVETRRSRKILLAWVRQGVVVEDEEVRLLRTGIHPS